MMGIAPNAKIEHPARPLSRIRLTHRYNDAKETTDGLVYNRI